MQKLLSVLIGFLMFAACTATPTPTSPPPPFVVEQTLARAVLPYNQLSRTVCEWDVLGVGNGEVYIWAVCMGMYRAVGVGETAVSLPLLLTVDAQGHVTHVTPPRDGIYYAPSIRQMFPPEVADIALHFDGGDAAARAEQRFKDPTRVLQSVWPFP